MAKGKQIREKGKIKLSSYFKKIDDGDFVAVNIDKGVSFALPGRIQGKSGKVIGSRGRCNLVEIKDGRKNKIYIVHPVHLKKLNIVKTNSNEIGSMN